MYNFLLILLIFMFAVHGLALGGFLGYGLWWLDVVLHFLGGLWLAVLGWWYLFAYKYFPEIKSRGFSGDLISGTGWILVVGLISFAVFAGVLWEFFEFSWDYFLAKPYSAELAQPSLEDTLSDLFFDLVGALVAVFYLSYYYRLGFRNSKKEE